MSTTPPPATPAPGSTPAPAAPQAAPAAQPTMYLSFTEQVQQPIADTMISLFAELAKARVADVHLLLATSGGDVAVGVNLCNHLRASPITLTTHATSNVDSIGILLFLAGRHRLAVPSACFTFHSVTVGVVAGVIDLRFARDSVASMEREGRRLAEIVVSRTGMSQQDARDLYLGGKPVTLTAEEALAKNIVHRIEEANIPAGAPYAHLKVPPAKTP